MTTRETELLAANAALELEVVRLRDALEHLSKAAGQTIDVRTPKDWVNLNIGLSLSIQALSTPLTPTALNELVEKAERLTIERCAQMFSDSVIGGRYLADQVRTISTGQIKPEELL